ncbi:MAG: hypothetical protein CL930_11670 [Deltaproteobacteria bacterium]|nr:hypothetical protein [Deltaproteobacteria bacterium]MAY81429.1 hypothetical protein [Deltaproteobacteria bacterium]
MGLLRLKLEWLMPLAWLLGCGGGSSQDTGGSVAALGECDQPEVTQVAVITEMWFARIEDGVTWGTDLDGNTTGCGIDDYVDPEGNGGIDNASGGLVPILELTEGAAIEVYLQNMINSGELLLMIEIEDVDDPMDDTCVDVNLVRALGSPTVGTDRIIESGQTFDRDPNLPSSRTEGMSISSGTLLASPLYVSLPLQYFDDHLTINIQGSTLRVDQGVDGHVAGYLAGGVLTEEITSFVDGRGDIDIGDLMISLLETNADLWPDENGDCKGISFVLEYRAKPAFFYLD